MAGFFFLSFFSPFRSGAYVNGPSDHDMSKFLASELTYMRHIHFVSEYVL